MKSQYPSTTLNRIDNIKNFKAIATRKRKGMSLAIGVGVIFVLVGAALYISSSVSAARGISRVSAPAEAAHSAINQQAGSSINRLKNNLSAGKGSNVFAALMSPPSLDESIATFEVVADACTSTPKSAFVLGDKVCAVATNAPLRSPTALRQFNWADPRGFVRQSVDVVADPDMNIFTLPSSNTSSIDGTSIDNRGTWTASLNSTENNTTRAIAYFTVSDPANLAADLVIYNFSTSNSSESDSITAGTNTGFFLWLTNNGPDTANNVHATMAVPPNMSYLSATTSSPFVCTLSAGVVDCTVASWTSGSVATITLNFMVSGAAPDGVISSTANISSDTNDPHPDSNSASASVEVRTPGAPPATCSLGCPSNMVVTATGPSGAVVNFSGGVEVSGDCGSIQFSPASGSTFPIGTTAVNVTSTSGGGSCSFTVEVINTAAPTISCPADQNAVAPSGSGEATVSTGTPTATGTGVAVTGARSDERDVTDPYPIGDTTIIWTATDSDQRTASCTQHVVVTSVDAPTISCPSDKTFDAGGDCQKTLTEAQIGTPTTGGLNPVTTSARSDGLALTDPYPVGVTTIAWTATNFLGSVSCTQKITITASGDTTPPTLNVPADVSVTTNTCSAQVDDELGVATASDTCSTVSITRTGVPTVACPIPGNPGRTCETFTFPVGTTNVTYTATDGAGNQTVGVQHVTVHETSPPVFTFVPGNVGPINTGAGATSCSAFVGDATLGTATVSDNCDNTVIRTGVPAGNIFPVGVTTITYTAKADTSVTATQTVTVVDNTPPVVTAPAPVTLYTGAGATSCGVTVSDLNATFGTGSATDNCAVGSVSRSGVPAGNVFPVGQTTLTYSATDSHNNTGSATQLVTVVDNTPPQISCQADIIADFNPAVNGAVVTFTAPVGTDNCASNTTQTHGLPSGSTFPTGTTVNTFTVTDASNNSTSCSFKVTVALTSLIGLDSVTISGSGYADSYSSSGGYPATKSSLANILSNGTITIGGSGKVWGNVRSTRVNVNMTGSSQVTGNATAGTTVTTSGSATVLGTRTNNALAPTMTLPAVPACSPFSSNSGISGTYTYNAGTGDLTVSGVNIATLANGNYCFHNITLGNSGQLKVNGPVVIKMTGTLNTSGSSNLNNTTQIPANLEILSSYSGTNGVVIGNSVSVYALIYAPQTGLNMSGSAPLLGTFAGKTITIGNSGAIHYDTQLKSVWPAIWTLIFGP